MRTTEPFHGSILCDRARHAPRGFSGGDPGALGELVDDGVAPSNPKAELVVPPGSVVEGRLPGGGGCGPPRERDPELVARDRVEEYVTRR